MCGNLENCMRRDRFCVAKPLREFISTDHEFNTYVNSFRQIMNSIQSPHTKVNICSV